jgi:hypothetical protein
MNDGMLVLGLAIGAALFILGLYLAGSDGDD